MSAEFKTLASALSRSLPGSVVGASVVAGLVGFAGSVALVVEAARAVGAKPDEIASWVFALCLGIAASSLYLCLRHRMPIITAWSTPGAALIATDGVGMGLGAAVGAFVVTSLLIVLSALVGPFSRLIERIPRTIAAAMLAGILLQFCIMVARAVPESAWLVLSLISVFALTQLWSTTLAVPVTLALGTLAAATTGTMDPSCCTVAVSALTIVQPEFQLQSIIGLALPLFVVTMASQNLAGLAVLKADAYHAPAQSCFGATGIASLLTAPFGGHGVCLSSITAAICTGPDCHPDPKRRWLVGPIYAAFYVLAAVFAGSLVELLFALPAVLITTFVGLALFGPLAGSLKLALSGDSVGTKVAVVTFVVAASGFSFMGVGSAPWSLATGLAILGLRKGFETLKSRAG